MIKLKHLLPTNLSAEKEKFFAKQTNYNPQFEYPIFINQSDLNVYGRARWRYTRLAKKIIKQAQKENLFKDSRNLNNRLEQNIAKKMIVDYLKDYALAEKYQVVFQENFTSRFAVNFKENSIKVRLPINYTQNSFMSTLDHEIGTHILRQENYLQQKWYRHKKHYGFNNHLRTEEGLAVIHQYLSRKQQLVYRTALSYLGAKIASKSDFKTVYQFFFQFLENEEKSWSYALKNKRGLTDTSLPGGFSKSLVYLEGFEQVLKYLKKQQYDPSLLYYGKIALEDVDKAKKMNPHFKPLLPKFYTIDPETYQQKVIEIAKRNFIF
jgi:hypothetical protein